MNGYTLTPDASNAIKIARVLCISLMMFVHFWPGATRVQAADVATPLHVFYVVLISEFGRASVPLLSIVSGLLLSRSLGRGKAPRDLFWSKFRTLIVPMVVWSALFLLLLIGKAVMTGTISDLQASPLTWANRFLALTEPPANPPLGFLRDLFVCSLYALAALQLERARPGLGQAALVAVMVAEVWFDGLLMLRTQILVFFCVGVLIARNARQVPVPGWPVAIGVAAIDVVVQQGVTTQTFATETFHRAAVAILLWQIAVHIAGRPGRLRQGFLALEPYIFVVFCSHLLTVSVYGEFQELIGISPIHVLFPIFFVANLPLCHATGVLVERLVRRHLPGALQLIAGKGRGMPRANRA